MKTTYFGLEIVKDQFVRLPDVERLPFADFWRESSRGSAMLVDQDTGASLVYLHDWEAFALLFIKTGKHPAQVDGWQERILGAIRTLADGYGPSIKCV